MVDKTIDAIAEGDIKTLLVIASVSVLIAFGSVTIQLFRWLLERRLVQDDKVPKALESMGKALESLGRSQEQFSKSQEHILLFIKELRDDVRDFEVRLTDKFEKHEHQEIELIKASLKTSEQNEKTITETMKQLAKSVVDELKKA